MIRKDENWGEGHPQIQNETFSDMQKPVKYVHFVYLIIYLGLSNLGFWREGWELLSYCAIS